MKNTDPENSRPKEIRIVLPRTYGSLNEYIRACRKSPFAGADMKSTDEIWTCYCIKSQNVPEIPDDWLPLRFSFFFAEKNMKRDFDNISGYAHKIIFDAFQKTIIPEDNWNVVGCISDTFAVDAAAPRVEITVSPYRLPDGSKPMTPRLKKEKEAAEKLARAEARKAAASGKKTGGSAEKKKTVPPEK